MLKNHKLAKAISEASWYIFRTFLEYKATWYKRNIIISPSHYASSHLCSHGEDQNREVKDLKVREWICPQCKSKHDRDINAAKNLLKLIKD